jgi:GT2 family glycosyltransferase
MIKVSAIVSLYNSREYVDSCLQDLVEQSLFKRGQLEIVVIDSNSPQDERYIVEQYQARHPNIVYHRTEQRETLYQAWNRGIQIARGEFLTNANADDRHHPEGIEVMYRALVANPAIDLVYGDVYESSVPNERFFDNPRTRRYSYPTFFAPTALLFYQFGCQPMWRRRVHDVIGGFSSTLKAAGDWEFSFRFARAGLRALHLPMVLGSFLQRSDSISSGSNTSHQEQTELYESASEADILALYAVEGYAIDTPQQQARVFTDFAQRASAMLLPWQPEGAWIEPRSAVMACLAAYSAAKGDPRAAWNLGITLLRTSQRTQAIPYLQQGSTASDPIVVQTLAAFSRGEEIPLRLVDI